MAELPMKKRLLVLRLYLEGYPYAEISTRAGVAKGSITAIVNDVRAGRLPAPADMGEQVEVLREVAIELRRSRLSGAQAAVGLPGHPGHAGTRRHRHTPKLHPDVPGGAT